MGFLRMGPLFLAKVATLGDLRFEDLRYATRFFYCGSGRKGRKPFHTSKALGQPVWAAITSSIIAKLPIRQLKVRPVLEHFPLQAIVYLADNHIA